MSSSPIVSVIEPRSGWSLRELPSIWRARELLAFFVWRDLKVRYSQTILGAAWAILQPLLTMLVFTLFFGRLAKMPSDGIPYPIFSYAALVPWTFFANSLTQSSNSLVSSAELLRRVYFPRMLIPMSSVLAGLVDFAIALTTLFVMMVAYGVPVSLKLLALPGLIALAAITGLGAGLWLSAMNVRFRDVRYAVPFGVQLWMFITPIAYPSSLLPEPWRTVYAINPMAGVVEGFRWAIAGAETAPGPMLAVSTVAALLMLVTGLRHFGRAERSFADVI